MRDSTLKFGEGVNEVNLVFSAAKRAQKQGHDWSAARGFNVALLFLS